MLEAAKHLHVLQLGEPDNGATRLNRFDQFRGVVAGQGESCGGGEFSHDHAEGLLGTGRERVGFVEDDDLVHAGRHVHFLVSKALDLVSDDLDASLIRGVHFQDGRLDCLTQHLVRHAQNTGRLSCAWRALQKQKWRKSTNCALYKERVS